MPISDKDRKRLWAKSGNRCAICRQELIMTNDNQSDYNIGEECHIVSSKPNGPRHENGWENYDVYENLILLCRNHHKTIDDISNILLFPKESLISIKSKHETWVKEELSTTNKTDRVNLITTGSELAAILSGCYAMERSNDTISTKEDAEYIGSIWQTLTDYMDIYSDWEPYQQTQVEYDLQKLLDEVSQKGYFIYGARVTRIIKYPNGKSDKWPAALIYIHNVNIASIYEETSIS
ncbi:HNH endonuclease signature motif containing protein [Bacteroides caecimuris]|uniref:HNH endonuclease n=1 Tax=Bacteroides caecimuris TaxID=1796613 RepID=UPI00242ECF62|nr:HNH endonuclease signature motif containing protein [Bacteroides caecimuris]